MTTLHSLLLLTALAADPLVPGDHARTLQLGGLERRYLVHVPPKYDHKTPTPVVLVYHGGARAAARDLTANSLASPMP